MSVQAKLVQSGIQLIPLNKLASSPRNVRKKDRKADIEALAASIAAKGLLQNLCVVAGEGDRFEVEAGGRRRLALMHLAKTGVIAKDFPVPCQVVDRENGREISLAENVHRVGMDAMDEVDAYAALVAEGRTPDEIARRFGGERRHVDQRLALSSLSPKIKAAWKRGDINLEAARAFCAVSDHAQQNAVFRSLGHLVEHPDMIRSRLVDGRILVTDRMAQFVGLYAYRDAGGTVSEDLFDDEATFIENPALLTRLAEDKLGAGIPALLAEGWGWADMQLGAGRIEGLSTLRGYPGWRDPTPDEQSELDRLTAEIEALDAELEANAIDDDPRWSQRDDLEAAYETVRQKAHVWDPDMRALCGVVLSIARNGQVSISEGAVRSSDEKALRALQKPARTSSESAGLAGEGEAAHVSELPKVLNRELSLVRTQVIRQALASDPDRALAVCVAGLAASSLQRSTVPGLNVSARFMKIEDLSDLADMTARLQTELPDDEADLLDWALDQSRDRLLAALGILISGAIDLAHEDTTPADLRMQDVGDRLAQTLDIDMTRYWQADLGFWTWLSKRWLVAALEQTPGLAAKSAASRGAIVKAHTKLRREELAAKVAGFYEGTGYLPAMLVTPVAAGALAVTVEGVEALSTSLQAAE